MGAVARGLVPADMHRRLVVGAGLALRALVAPAAPPRPATREFEAATLSLGRGGQIRGAGEGAELADRHLRAIQCEAANADAFRRLRERWCDGDNHDGDEWCDALHGQVSSEAEVMEIPLERDVVAVGIAGESDLIARRIKGERVRVRPPPRRIFPAVLKFVGCHWCRREIDPSSIFIRHPPDNQTIGTKIYPKRQRLQAMIQKAQRRGT